MSDTEGDDWDRDRRGEGMRMGLGRAKVGSEIRSFTVSETVTVRALEMHSEIGTLTGSDMVTEFESGRAKRFEEVTVETECGIRRRGGTTAAISVTTSSRGVGGLFL